LNSGSTVLSGDTSVMTTTSASSFANSVESMPTQRASYEIVVTSYAVTGSESVVYTPAAPAVSTAILPCVRGVSATPSTLSTDDSIVTSAGSDGSNGARLPDSKSLAKQVSLPGAVGCGLDDGVSVDDGVLVGEAVTVLLPLDERVALVVPVPVIDGVAVPVVLVVLVSVADFVPVELGDPVPVWELVEELVWVPVPDKDPVLLADLVPDSVWVPVPVSELVPELDGVPVPDDDAVPVCDDEDVGVWDGVVEGVDPLEEEPDGVTVCEPVIDAVAVDVAVEVCVADDVGVEVRVLVLERGAVSESVEVALAETVTLLVDVGVKEDEVVGKGETVEVAVALSEPERVTVTLALDVLVTDALLEPVRDDVPLGLAVALTVSDPVTDAVDDGVCVLAAVAVTDCEVDTVAVNVCDGVGCRMRTTMLSTRNDELPADTPSPLTTDSCSTTDAAPSRRRSRDSAGAVGGGSTALRRTHPVRPNTPTSETETLYSTVVVTAPDADVATAATCALSLRKSREANWDSHETSIS